MTNLPTGDTALQGIQITVSTEINDPWSLGYGLAVGLTSDQQTALLHGFMTYMQTESGRMQMAWIEDSSQRGPYDISELAQLFADQFGGER